MRRGTTPTYMLKFETGKAATIADICLSFKQRSKVLSLHMSDDEIILIDDTAFVTLTQEQTASFEKGALKRQVKVKYVGGTIESSDVQIEPVFDELHEDTEETF